MSELKEAFREAARRQFAMVPAESELDWAFSPGFERKMRRIIRAQAHGYWNLVNTTAKRIAIAAAIIVMLLSSVLAIKPVRERVIKFFIEVYEDYFEIRFGEEEKDDIDPTPKPMVRYTLTELPEGYEEVAFMELEHMIWTHWRDNDENSISLNQETGTQEIISNHQEDNQDTIILEGLTIVHQKEYETDVYLWEQNGYVFALNIHEDVSTDQALKLISSLEEKTE